MVKSETQKISIRLTVDDGVHGPAGKPKNAFVAFVDGPYFFWATIAFLIVFIASAVAIAKAIDKRDKVADSLNGSSNQNQVTTTTVPSITTTSPLMTTVVPSTTSAPTTTTTVPPLDTTTQSPGNNDPPNNDNNDIVTKADLDAANRNVIISVSTAAVSFLLIVILVVIFVYRDRRRELNRRKLGLSKADLERWDRDIVRLMNQPGLSDTERATLLQTRNREVLPLLRSSGRRTSFVKKKVSPGRTLLPVELTRDIASKRVEIDRLRALADDPNASDDLVAESIDQMFALESEVNETIRLSGLNKRLDDLGYFDSRKGVNESLKAFRSRLSKREKLVKDRLRRFRDVIRRVENEERKVSRVPVGGDRRLQSVIDDDFSGRVDSVRRLKFGDLSEGLRSYVDKYLDPFEDSNVLMNSEVVQYFKGRIDRMEKEVKRLNRAKRGSVVVDDVSVEKLGK